MATGVSIDDREIRQQLHELRPENLKKYLRRVTGVGLSVAKKAVQKQVSILVTPGGKSLKRYIKTFIYKNDPGRGQINILGRNIKSRNKETKKTEVTSPYYLRFFEMGTRVRYLKTRNGKLLAKKKKIGNIDATHFFSSALSSAESDIFNTMKERVYDIISKINAKSKK